MSVPPDTGACYNPAIDVYLATHEWTENGWTPTSDTTPISCVPEYIPTDTAIETLASHGPLVEIGAGHGYWAHVINKHGGDIIPTDIDTQSRLYYWCDITQGTHQDVQEYDERDVLLCHPPGFVWTVDLLWYMNPSQSLIYIGEWGLSQDATKEFFETVQALFELTETFPVVNWETTNAKGYVFEPLGNAARFSHGLNMMHYALLMNDPYKDNPPDSPAFGFNSSYNRNPFS